MSPPRSPPRSPPKPIVRAERGELREAAREGKLAKLARLLRDEPSIDVEDADERGRSALWWAVERLDAHAIARLLARGAAPDGFAAGASPLLEACGNGEERFAAADEAAGALLSAGADATRAGRSTRPPCGIGVA